MKDIFSFASLFLAATTAFYYARNYLARRTVEKQTKHINELQSKLNSVEWKLEVTEKRDEISKSMDTTNPVGGVHDKWSIPDKL